MARVRLLFVGVVSMGVVVSGVNPGPGPVAQAAPSEPDVVSAADSVIKIGRSVVRPGELPGASALSEAGRSLEQAVPADVRWPTGGLGAVRVPSVGDVAKVASSAVAVTAPSEDREGLEDPVAGLSALEDLANGAQVAVRAFGAQTAERLGGRGTAFRVARADGGAVAAKVGVRIDVSGFADAFGANFESRLRLVSKPACALETPEVARCQVSTPVPSHVDLTTHTLVADVPATSAVGGLLDGAGSADGGVDLGPLDDPLGTTPNKPNVPDDPTPPDDGDDEGDRDDNGDEVNPLGRVFVLAAATEGETGSATATKLASSSKWSVGLQSGDFTWSLPLPKVPALSGKAPEFDLAYSSQAVDGMVAAENNQPSWVGQGWDLALPYLERRYNGCVDDGGDTGDLCWAGDELRLSLEGTSSALVRDREADGDVWRAREDPGWRVQRHRGADNGDDDGEYWVVTTPQGMRYTFGRGEQNTTGTATDSVLTVPVFGDDDGEPCNEGDVEDSWCRQAWRWNLDRIVDPHGNSSTYFYEKETNRYARNGEADDSTGYDRGGVLRDIVYSQRAGSEDTQAPARLHFSTERRCIEAADGDGTCPAFDEDNASSYPDVPLDALCTGECTGEEQKSPTFFTGFLLRSVTAQRSGEDGGWVDVDRLDFTYGFPEPSDGTSAALWLEKVQQTGLGGSGSETLPAVEFTGRELANRADADPEAGAPLMRKLRISSVIDELGRRVDVGYSQPDPCPVDDLPPAYDTNTQDCFPGWRSNGEDSGFGVWHKYLTTKVTVRDTAGGSPPQVTQYRYRGDPAWHVDDDPVTPNERESWGDWRGYGSVDVAKMSDPGYRGEDSARALELTRSLFFRGMHGDRLSGGGTRDVKVTDSQGTALTDWAYLRGKEREVRQFAVNAAGEPTHELGGSLKGYTSARTTPAEPGDTDAQDDAHQVVENDSESRETVIPEDGGARTSRTTRLRTTHDHYGQPTEVLDVAGSGDDVDRRCTRTWYARDDATVEEYLLAFPYRVRTYTGTCKNPTDLVTGKDQYYDGSDTLGGTVEKGDVTRTVSARTADGPNAVTSTTETRAGFDAYGRTTSETDANGNTSRTAFSPATGRPTTVTETNPLGHAETSTMDPDRQQAVAVEDANGQVVRNTYDPLGRLTSVRQADQDADAPPAQAFGYRLDPAHREAPRVTNRQLLRGDTYVTTWSFLDSLGRDRQRQERSPASTEDEPKTVVTDTRHDDAGHVAAEGMSAVAPGGPGTALLDVPADEVDEVRHSYDELGRVVRTAQFGMGEELWSGTNEYFGDHVRGTPPDGGLVTTSWTDARGREVRRQEGTGADVVTTSTTYTAADNVASVTDPEGHRSVYTYDLLGRRVEATDPDTGHSRTRFDGNGNPVALWDAETLADGGGEPTISTDHDALNRPVGRWAGASGTGRRMSTWEYDSTRIANGIGQMSAQITHEGRKEYAERATGYDPRGRVTGKKWSFPEGLLGGLLADQTYEVGYGYDEADHVISKEYPDSVVGAPAETVTTGYDDLGNPSTLTGVKIGLLGDKVEEYVSASKYAADGKLASRDYANPFHPLRRAYGYEADTQRLSRVQTLVGGGLLGGLSGKVSGAGELSGELSGGGELSGEAAGELTGELSGDGEMKVKQDDTYRWDPAGNLQSITDASRQEPVATCFDYDGLSRIGHAWTTKQTDCSDADDTKVHDGPAGFNESWTYTDDGNISSHRSLLGGTKTFEYEDPAHPHAVTKAGHKSFKYDANGAMKKKHKAGVLFSTMEWDAEHRLTSFTTEALLKTRFVYAPDGTRMARIDPTGTATLYIDGQEINLLVGIGLTAEGTRFYQLQDTTVAERVLGILKWRLNDIQGSSQIHVVAGTSVLGRTYYNPYGQIRHGSIPPPTDKGFLGKTKDPTTGLNAMDARYYDADLGRFISADPAYDITTAQHLNPYSYGANNPVMYADPTGLWSLGGAWNAVKNAGSAVGDWASENKGLIANVAVGIGVGVAVGALCATGVGCLVVAGVAAGAAGAAAGYGVDAAEGKVDPSLGGFAKEVGIGAAAGAAGGLLGKGLAVAAPKVVGAVGRTAAGKAVASGTSKAAAPISAAASKAGTAVANTARAAGSKVAEAAKSAARALRPKARPATQQPIGGGGKVLADAEGASAREVALSAGGETGGSRAGQETVRQELLRDGPPYTCWRCGQTTNNPANMHVGHRNKAVSAGGNLTRYNACLEGAACNLGAGNRGVPSPGMSCADRGSCGAPYGRTD